MNDVYPSHWEPRLFHHYFLQFSKSRAEQPAIISHERCWTYRDLVFHAARYKDILIRSGLKVGDRMVMDLYTCPQAIGLIVACSMTGVVFVPVSPDSPQKRVEDIIDQTQAKLHVQSAASKREFHQPGMIQGYLDQDELYIPKQVDSAAQEDECVLDTDLAYMVFTSGTTGRPKGIMMSHRAVLTFFKGLVEFCSLQQGMRVGTYAPFQFDFSILDMGLAFGSGGALVQIPQVLAHHPKKFVKFLNDHHVFQMNGVPSLWNVICLHGASELRQLVHLRQILYAGEFFPMHHLKTLQARIPSLQRIINCFGQSESIACSFIDVPNPIGEEIEQVPIGCGHPGVEILLLDEAGNRIRTTGVPGEMYLRGSSLFSGYWKNPELTNQVLVPHPLRPSFGEKVFKTGDRAFIGSDQKLYYIGRTDNQVQMMGNRIELEEVERAISSHPVIKDATVALVDGQPPELIAFVITGDKEGVTETQIRKYCSQKLPPYMLPTKFITVEGFPYTENGKIDRARLIAEKYKPATLKII